MTCETKHNARTVSLTVVSTPPQASQPARPRSRMGVRRAIVLGTIQLLMILHVVQWLWTGTTLSPVEPSEAMATVKDGVVNAGAILFGMALLSTVFLGRWFCGWACHVVMLQDLCTWMLEKLGIRPKPFRSRLLLYVPLLLAIYMFLWPVVYRLALAPYLRPDLPPFGFSRELIVEDFWRTFPGAFMAVPFLLVCGFLTVYLLGSKGYCTYGCPYGGFFAPLDEYAVGRIRVNDSCEHCGHCTAVCTSNVRVHEEVRDFGMVVDPGCMKCMDCVSACPNDALSFGFGKPASLRAPRPGTAPTPRAYDLPFGEELLVAAVAAIAFLAVRGSVGTALPLLFASGVTACATFVVWKGWRAIRDENVRFHGWQLRIRGRWTLAGYAWTAASSIVLVLAGYTAALNVAGTAAGWIDDRVTIPPQVVFSGNRIALSPEEERSAKTALAIYEIVSGIDRGGWAVLPVSQIDIDVRRAWLLATLGRFSEAEALVRTSIEREGIVPATGAAIARLQRGQNRDDLADATYRDLTAAHPDWRDLQEEYVVWLSSEGRTQDAIAAARAALGRRPDELMYMRRLSIALMEHGSFEEIEEGVALTRRTLEIAPDNPFAYRALARGYFRLDRLDEAEGAMRRAVELAPDDWRLKQALGEMLIAIGKPEEGAPLLKEAKEHGVFGESGGRGRD
jgi:ferredoxin-type protein NapH